MKIRMAVVLLCFFSINAAAQGHPDLTGMWNGGPARGPAIRADDPLGAYLPSRDGTLLNFERDNTIIRRMDPNKPLYKPEFWEKVQKLDQDGNTADPSFGWQQDSGFAWDQSQIAAVSEADDSAFNIPGARGPAARVPLTSLDVIV